jgi:hypothetical protein
MNAQLVWQTDETWGDRVVEALTRVRLSTRVLLFAAGAMLGALTYMSANWPAAQVPVSVSVIAQKAPTFVVAQQPLVPVKAASPVAKVDGTEATFAGSLVVGAARSVSAAATGQLSARANPAAAPAPIAAAAAPAGVSSVSATRNTVRGAPAGRFAPQNADSAADTVSPSSAPGVNHISVPTPASASGAAPNHIAIPPTQPPATR